VHSFRPDEFTPDKAMIYAETLFTKTKRAGDPVKLSAKSSAERKRTRVERLIVFAKEQLDKGNIVPLQHALQFPAGRKEFSWCGVKLPGPNNTSENCRSLVAAAGPQHKKEIIRRLSQNLSTTAAADLLDVSKAAIKYARTTRPSKSCLADAKKAPGVRGGRCNDEIQLYLQMYKDTTTVYSGHNSNRRRNLEMSMHDWQTELYVLWPSQLREFAWMNPEVVKTYPQNKRTLSNFEQQVLAAIAQSKLATFNGFRELDDRRKEVNTLSLFCVCFFSATDVCLLLFVRQLGYTESTSIANRGE
jgi:hypothetical protein